MSTQGRESDDERTEDHQDEGRGVGAGEAVAAAVNRPADPGRIGTNAPLRCRHDGVRRAPKPIRTGRSRAGVGGEGPGLRPERQAGEVAIVARANWLLGATATELDPLAVTEAVALAPRGSETGRCLSVPDYVTGIEARDRATAAGWR